MQGAAYRSLRLTRVIGLGLTVRGKVQNTGGIELPFARMEWRLKNSPNARAVECVADFDGRFEARGLLPGDYLVSVIGLASREEPVSAAVHVTRQNANNLTVVVDPLPSLLILVNDERGNPVPGIVIAVHYSTKHSGNTDEVTVVVESSGQGDSGL